MKRVLTEITNNLPKNIKLTIHRTNKRTKLIRWLYEVIIDFEYRSETYILAVTILDRFLIKNKVCDLQLVGISALFVAAKIEETTVKSVTEYVCVTENYCSAKCIAEMEKEILLFFSFSFNFVLPHKYLKREYLASDILCEKEYSDLIGVVICGIMKKEGNNMYYVMEKARTVCKGIIDGDAVSNDMLFYLNKNMHIYNLINKTK